MKLIKLVVTFHKKKLVNHNYKLVKLLLQYPKMVGIMAPKCSLKYCYKVVKIR